MKNTVLDKIIEQKRRRVAEIKRLTDAGALERAALATADSRSPFRMFRALSSDTGVKVIAEFKRASPSKGAIGTGRDPSVIANAYEAGGAAAISVLTEEEHFGGGLADLNTVRKATRLPVLRKDFFIDEFQLFESAAAGADAILLIVAALSTDALRMLYGCARSLGLDAIVEVHDEKEIEVAAEIGAAIIGVNNRDLKTLHVSLDVSRRLIPLKPEGSVMIAESGISGPGEIRELHSKGFDAFLIGEALMRSAEPAKALAELISPEGVGAALK